MMSREAASSLIVERAMTVDEVWRNKSDEQLLAASAVLEEYNEAGRHAILAELQRRRAAGVFSAPSIETETVEASYPTGADELISSLPMRLWRGQVSLVKTFWIFGIGVNLVLRALIVFAVSVRPMLVVMLAVYIAYLVFSYVAIWRSADRYEGDASWRNLARIWVVLSLVGGLLNALR